MFIYTYQCNIDVNYVSEIAQALKYNNYFSFRNSFFSIHIYRGHGKKNVLGSHYI